MKLSKLLSNQNTRTLVVILISLILISWGSTGHYKINYSSALSFNQDMDQFHIWTEVLADHASDADIRKATDPTEAPKHYIDIDNYSEFISDGIIPQIMEDAITAHGETFVYDQGILPWATLISYDSLVSCFERGDWDKAVLFASDLGHYVADGHMPLHLTRNYNGQFTNNYGVHSRYESTMINAYISQIEYDGLPIEIIQDVDQYVFDYIYQNYIYVDSVIAADDYAEYVAGNTSSTEYKQALWEASNGFTIILFRDASHALTEMIYTAWTEAGSPSMTENINEINTGLLVDIFPNPFNYSSQINYYLNNSSEISVELRSVTGQLIEQLEKGNKQIGEHSIFINGEDLPSGVYFIILRTEESIFSQKIIKAL